VLIAASEWGTPPWEIAGGSRLTWYLRWNEWKKLEHKRMQQERNGRKT
jgi:hypothetical protein